MRAEARELAEITGGTLTGDDRLVITSLLTDSRSHGAAPDKLFIALRGPNHDGHKFIPALYKRGVRLFLVDGMQAGWREMGDATFIVTHDTLAALHKIAGWWRGNFRGKVIAITGSAGKTVVKEWLAGVISLAGSVIRSPKSFNSQVGVALSLLNLDNRYSVAVIEAGISFPGEMEKLERIIRPDVVILTNIGDAHGENFSDRSAIAAEKLLLASRAGRIICSSDDVVIIRELSSRYRHIPLFSWSLSGNAASLQVRLSDGGAGRRKLSCTTAGSSFEAVIPFADQASVENAVSVIACCLSESIPGEIIIKGVEELPVVAMRMETKQGINGSTLIEDYYNSDPVSLTMALDFLRSSARGRSTLIMSDFREVGGDEREVYKGVAVAIKNAGIDRFIGIGEALLRQRQQFPSNSHFFTSTADCLSRIRTLQFSDETILLKGARQFGLEQISRLLERQHHHTRLEISMDAVIHNLNEFRRLLKPGTGVIAMVKAFAYGSGSAEIASLLEHNGVSCFAVARADEGVALREAGITSPVMVMSSDDDETEQIIHHNLEPEIYNPESLESFASAARRYGLLDYPVHIKIDTGMHRLGFGTGDIDELISLLKGSQHIKAASLFSHLSASDEAVHDDFTHRQAGLLIRAGERLRRALGYSFNMHLLNSSGIARFPEYQFDMVRLGIGLYGVGHFHDVELQRTGRFVSKVIQVRRVPAGEPVGYGCRGSSENDREIAVIPVGYADGLRRELGEGRGALAINGCQVTIVGSVCMDMCMADVTGLNVQRGDEAEVFGNTIPIERVATLCNTIPYEILTSIPSRVKRIWVSE